MVEYTGAKYAIATVNGTAALQVALLLAGVEPGDEVLTQAITFVATANAISYCGAKPVFLDSDRLTLGLSSDSLEEFLVSDCIQENDGYTYNRKTRKRISVCVPVHILGHPAQIKAIKALCNHYNISLVEDAAEALGSFFQDKHTGTFGKLGILSFNGNKIITTGGGGMILTDDEELGVMAKHLTTTAKVAHRWEYVHDQVGFNYRLPNINAAMGCAQMEILQDLLLKKRELATEYKAFFETIRIPFVSEPEGSCSNYWLNAVLFNSLKERNDFLEYSNDRGVMTRPLWTPLPKLPMYLKCQTDRLENAYWLEERLVSIPSSVRP
jgi:aminotransferase in exopolysaccharide biosynthesis